MCSCAALKRRTGICRFCESCRSSRAICRSFGSIPAQFLLSFPNNRSAEYNRSYIEEKTEQRMYVHPATSWKSFLWTNSHSKWLLLCSSAMFFWSSYSSHSWATSSWPIAWNSPGYPFVSLYFCARTERSFWENWLLQTKVGFSTILTRVMQCVSLEENTCLRKSSSKPDTYWAFSPRSVSFTACGIRKEYCTSSCSRKDSQSQLASTPINLRNWGALFEEMAVTGFCPPSRECRAAKNLQNIEDVERAASESFDSQSLQFCHKVNTNVPIRWHTVVANDDGYIIERTPMYAE